MNEKEAEAIRLLQEYLARRRELEQIPGTQEYEIEQMCRKAREEVSAMTPEERLELQQHFQKELQETRARMAKEADEPYIGDSQETVFESQTNICTVWHSYLIYICLNQAECVKILRDAHFDFDSVPPGSTDFSVQFKTGARRLVACLRCADSRAAQGGFWTVYELLDSTLADEQAFGLLTDFALTDKREPL